MNRIAQNGWNAAIIHLPYKANPYDYPSDNWYDWNHGWQKAHELMDTGKVRIEHAN